MGNFVNSGVDLEGPGIPIASLVVGLTFTLLTFLGVLCLIFNIRSQRSNASAIYTLLAFTLSILLVIQITWATISQLHTSSLNSDSRSKIGWIAESLFANQILWTLINALIRLSCLLSLASFFRKDKKFRYAVMVLNIIILLHGIAILAPALTICRPLSDAWVWNPARTLRPRCGPQVFVYFIYDIVGIALDLIIVLLPIRIFLKQSLNQAEKLGMCLVVFAGSMFMSISAVRINTMLFEIPPTISYRYGYMGLLSQLGCLLGVLACCVPSIVLTVRPVRNIRGSRETTG